MTPIGELSFSKQYAEETQKSTAIGLMNFADGHQQVGDS
jgi:hypothetical protein